RARLRLLLALPGADRARGCGARRHRTRGIVTTLRRLGRVVRGGCQNRFVSIISPDDRLSPLAAPSYPALRALPEEECSLRTPFQRHRDRSEHVHVFLS